MNKAIDIVLLYVALLCDECVERFTAMMERERDRECWENGRET